MTTKHDVRVTQASVADTGLRAACTCTCGWDGAAEATDEPGALSAAARECVDHLLESHPRQTPSSFLRPRAHARYLHPRSTGVAVQTSKRWSRHVACACGWTDTVRAGSPAATARLANARHREHVQLQTGRTPLRDYGVMAAVVLVVAAVLAAIAVVAVQAAGGDPSDLFG